ncbi:hypothetical protein [Streptomyces sp. SID3343]|uniref:hypothetical protein n=1 Tax=Streptomyces sp. SID3343 TaxID=2690260 RepID=UPI00136CAAE6|nr:hypothetical protein [Streptomyces sp. SID3343]MYW02613.1 hypothetical protein [Streptomyces sp. SID3343]
MSAASDDGSLPMRLRRFLALSALFVLLGSPIAYADPVPEPEDPPITTRQVEVSGIPEQVRPGAPATEFTVTFRNVGHETLFLEPEVRFLGDRNLTADRVRLEVFDPATNFWSETPLDADGAAVLPFRGAERLTATAGRLPTGADVGYLLRFRVSAGTTEQFVNVAIGSRYGPPRPDGEPRFDTATHVETAILAADGTMPAHRPRPGAPEPPSEPDAGPANSGATAKTVPQSRSTAVPAMSLVDVPGWVRAGGGAIEFRFTITNDTGRSFDEMNPQLVFTAGEIALVPDSLRVETRDMSGSRWSAVPFSVVVNPANGGSTHLLGSLTQTSWDDHHRLEVNEIARISVRVSVPAGSAAVGHDIAVSGAIGYPSGTGQRPVSHSDFRVFTVTASGSPAKAPTLIPEPPGFGPAAAGRDPAGARRPDRASDPFTWATIAIWAALAGVVGLVAWFAVKNRREDVGARSGPDA